MTRDNLLTALSFLLGAWLAVYVTEPRSQDYLVATVASYHFERGRGYNEHNYGLGFEHHVREDWSVSAGFYRNSFRRDTGYALATWTPWTFGPVRLGFTGGVLTGYSARVEPVVMPTVSVEAGGWGVNLHVLTSVVGLQVKKELR